MDTRTTKHIVIAIPVLLYGGTEIHTLALVKNLIRLGYKVTVCCYYECSDTTVSVFKTAGASVILLKRKRDPAAPLGFSELFLLLMQLRSLFRALRPDVLHVHYVAPGFIPIVAGRCAGVKRVLATIHSAGEKGYRLRSKFLVRCASWLCTRFISVSQSAGDFWFGRNTLFDPSEPKKSGRRVAIMNGVDTEALTAAGRRWGKAHMRQLLDIDKEKVVGFFGRLVPLKGLDVLLEAMYRVIVSYPSAVLIIIGDGNQRQRLEKYAEALKIQSHLRWIGGQPHEMVFEYYHLCDIVAVPSFFEGFGLTCAEAMAAGIPVVASNVDGLRDLVDHESTGLLVPPGDAEELSKALLRLLSDTRMSEKLGMAGKKKAIEYFSLAAFDKAYESLYKSLVET